MAKETARKKASKEGKTRWDLSELFRGDDDPGIDKNMQKVRRQADAFVAKWKARRDYLTSPTALREALDEYERWKRGYGPDGDAGYYFWLRNQEERNNPDLKARMNKIEELSRKIENDVQFFHLRIAKIPPHTQARLLSHKALARYRHFLERIFAESRFLLTEAEERVLNLKTATSYSNWVRLTSDFLSREERPVLLEDGKKATKPLPEILSLMNSRSRRVRDTAARQFNRILDTHIDVAEAEINSVLASKKVDDELRNVSRPDLLRHIGDDIESAVVDTLIEAVSNRFSISQAFYRLKARLMGVRRLRYHERNVEYGKITASYPYGPAFKMVHGALGALDPEFAEIISSFEREGRFDVHPRKHKSGGAFCVHHLLTQPTFILLNHTDKLHDVLTLAHELGHGINNEFIRKRQHALDFGTPTSTAEVASTFMEDFVLREVLRRSDEEERLAILMMKLNDDVSTIFRQVACYRFESALHERFREKGYLSKEDIGRLFREYMEAYMGEAVEQSRGSENWWIYWSHIRYFFYVYSYASGLLISKSLQRSVRDNPRFIMKVKGFLSAGFSDSPKNIFLRLGIDIADRNFWNRGLDEIEETLRETEELARRLGRIS